MRGWIASWQCKWESRIPPVGAHITLHNPHLPCQDSIYPLRTLIYPARSLSSSPCKATSPLLGPQLPPKDPNYPLRNLCPSRTPFTAPIPAMPPPPGYDWSDWRKGRGQREARSDTRYRTGAGGGKGSPRIPGISWETPKIPEFLGNPPKRDRKSLKLVWKFDFPANS